MRLLCSVCAFASGLAATVSPAHCADSNRVLHTTVATAPAANAYPGPAPIGSVIVHSRFGGQIFGFDIDPNGSEGLLTEAQTLDGGTVLAAVETFNQRTGAIVSVVKQTTTEDDFVTLGVLAGHIGLVEFEHEMSFLHIVRTFPFLNPLSIPHFNGDWTPPIDSDHLIEAVSRNRDSPTVAVYAYDNSENFRPQVFSSKVAANTFGPLVVLTDQSFQTGLVPKLGYNDHTRKALLGIQTLDAPFVSPTFALVDLVSGETQIFRGSGQGDVNGLAVDPITNIACTTTEIDFSVQFYDLDSLTGFGQPLPGANNQFYSGADVAVDPLHGLFLVAQPNSSTQQGSSSIYVYDETGNLVESINGFHFSNAGNVIGMHIALHPSQRFGYVDGPDPGVREIQSFVY